MPAGSEEPYESKVAELQEIRVKLAEDDPNQTTTLEDYSRLVYLFNKAQKYEIAVKQEADGVPAPLQGPPAVAQRIPANLEYTRDTLDELQ